MAAGGVGVLVVVGFVALLFLGTGPTGHPSPGDRIGLARDGFGQLTVLVPRCPSERVTKVSLSPASGGGRVVWAITSAKGSIDQRYPVSNEAPVDFVVARPLGGPLPPDPLVAAVSLSRPDDEVVQDATAPFTFAAVPSNPDEVLYHGFLVRQSGFEARAHSVADCPESRRHVDAGLLVLAGGALGVVLAYATMVVRWLRGR